MARYANRTEAGRQLADLLKPHRKDAIIFALPRGGVETAAEVAYQLNAPLELVVARKIGHPSDPEYAVGAVTENGPVVWHETERARLSDTWAAAAEKTARTEARRRRLRYQTGHTPLSAKNKTAIVIDDGVATGLTMQAALRELHEQAPRQLIVAVPVAPPDTISELLEDADDVIVLDDPSRFLGSVGAHYAQFPQLSDDDVIDLLERFTA